MSAEPSAEDLAHEVMELRVAIAALAEIAKDVDARAVSLEHRLRAIAAGAATPAIEPTRAQAQLSTDGAGTVTADATSLAYAAARDVAPGGHGHRHHHGHAHGTGRRRGRHRSRDPQVMAKERAAERRNAVVTALMMLPWIICIGLFAIALGLVAVSTFQ